MEVLFNGLLDDIYSLSNFHFVYGILFFIIMTIASYTDLKYMKIYNNFNTIALFIRIICGTINRITFIDVFGTLIIFFLMLIVGMINIKNDIGGDIKYSAVFAAWAGPYLACSSFLIGIILMSPISIIKKKPIPLAPFLQLGLIINLITYLVINNFII